MSKNWSNVAIPMPCTWIAKIKNNIPNQYDKNEFDLWRMDRQNEVLDKTVFALSKVDLCLQKMEGKVENLRGWVKSKSNKGQ